jgi:hypothetical protein
MELPIRVLIVCLSIVSSVPGLNLYKQSVEHRLAQDEKITNKHKSCSDANKYIMHLKVCDTHEECFSAQQKLIQKFLLKEYDTAKNEIKLRIEHEGELFNLMFTLIGAVMGIVFYGGAFTKAEQENIEDTFERRNLVISGFCWAALIVGIIVIMRRQINTDVMIQLGQWIRREVECQFLPNGILGWESFLVEQSSLFNSDYFPILKIERELLLSILFFVTFILLVPGCNVVRERFATAKAKDAFKMKQIRYLKLNSTFCSITSILIYVFAMHFHYEDPYLTKIYIFLLLYQLSWIGIWFNYYKTYIEKLDNTSS